ncbi:MAG: lytic transglycosylase domain-containing protein [Alphaproteobacteria bacterium]|nr:lytic transglycosylase domain-containing protein [Alphaproteobacteria bacterium]
MNIKQFGIYGWRLCVGLAFVGVILLPVQAAVFAPVPAMKPLKSLELSAPADIVHLGARACNGVPVPAMKPSFGQESQSAHKRKIFQPAEYMKLTDLLSTIKLYEPAAGDVIKDGRAVIETNSNINKPLSAHQSKLYAQIFNAQRHGHWDQVDKLLQKIKDKRLMGHVYYQRYMHPSYVSNFDELKAWLASYSDYPNAYNIYKLANAKRNGRPDAINNPGRGHLLAQIKEPKIYYPRTYVSKIRRTADQAKQARALTRKIYKLVRRGKSQDALEYLVSLDSAKSALAYMDKVEIDYIKAEIAAGFLYRGQNAQALALAKEANTRSGSYVPLAAWIVGLSLWEKQDFASAAPYFEKVGGSSYASGWRASAGYYWAARSYSRIGNHDKVRVSLEKASMHSRTFYGLISTKMLGKPFDFNWKNPAFSSAYESSLSMTSSGRRAFLLVAANQYDLAEEELLRLDYNKHPDLRRAALSYAMHVGLPGLALRLGNMIPSGKGEYYDSALYPDVPWEPQNGFSLDPSLLYAVMRQESRFDHEAKSNSGARGLMQIMPRTARYVAQKNRYGYNVGKMALNDPEINMMIGQDYLSYLLKGQAVKGDMISLLVAYNAGPGNLVKWRKRFEANKIAQKSALSAKTDSTFSDPLLFIETMPIEETRDYVAKVLSNYWIYRLRAGEELISLTHLVKGQSPRYASFIGQSGAQSYMVANR